MLKSLVMMLLVMVATACAAEADVPAAPGYHPVADDDGGVVAASEALTARTVFFRPACSPSAVDMIHSELSFYEGFVVCWPTPVSAGQAWSCLTASADHSVMYRIYRATASTADAEVYHVDSVGSHAAYRIHCSCPDPVFEGGGCFSGPF